jgi:Zn finger protein HypA/HybF involved in hydrogenase expression
VIDPIEVTGDIMCTVGGPMADIDIKKMKTRKCRCLDCGNEFKGVGRRVICPSCQSDNVECEG